MKTNFINLQRDGGANERVDSIFYEFDKPPIDHVAEVFMQQRLNGWNNSKTLIDGVGGKEVDISNKPPIDTPTIQEETNFEKFNKLVSDEVSPVHEMMKKRKQEDVWDDAINTYLGKLNEYGIVEWLRENYTLIKK